MYGYSMSYIVTTTDVEFCHSYHITLYKTNISANDQVSLTFRTGLSCEVVSQCHTYR